MERLRKRADFVAVGRGRRVEKPGFVLQAAARPRAADGGSGEAPFQTARFGFTVTKRLGNAAIRNRIRRRLREAVRIAGGIHAQAGIDYVLVGRKAALGLPFEQLVADVVDSLNRLSRQAEFAPARVRVGRGRTNG
jgi:ribonuclease P protein component